MDGRSGGCLPDIQLGQERLSKVIAIPSRVDAQAIDHIEVIFQHCKRQEDTFGPHAVLHTVIAQRELVDSLLDECSDELRPRLLSVYSNMSTSIGTPLFNLDDVASAMHYCEQARATTQEARNTELAIHALCTMSFFASWQGKAHAAIDFVAAAQNLGTQTDDHLLQARTATEFGLAYAVDGQYKECMAKCDRALPCVPLVHGLLSRRSTGSMKAGCQHSERLPATARQASGSRHQRRKRSIVVR
jgi:hypothetical protein